MVDKNNSGELPRDGFMDYPSGAAELLDTNFLENLDWHLNHYALLPLNEEILEESSTLLPEDSNSYSGLHMNPRHYSNLEQALHSQHQLHKAQALRNSLSGDTGIHYTKALEEAPYATNHTSAPQDQHNGEEINGDSQLRIGDQFWENLMGSLRNIEDFDIRFGQVPDFQFREWVDDTNMAEEFHGSHVDCIAGLSANANLPGTFANGVLSQTRELQSGFINSTFTWNDAVSNTEQLQSFRWRSVKAPRPIISKIPKNDLHGNRTLITPVNRQNKTPKKATYKRRANIDSIDPSKYYQDLPCAPPSWQPHSSDHAITFQYNEYGNLCTDNKFSPTQIVEYLYFHPLHYSRDNVYDPKNGRLTLWIQSVPADSGRRYPAENSDKCRFEDCPIPKGSIRNGFFRVAFDEQINSGHLTDPYHCAGFVHLFCLEKFCDFPQICKDLLVRPDEREFSEGKNKMAITRDHYELGEVVRAYRQCSQKPDPWDYKQTLNYLLTFKHLEFQCPTRQKKRTERGGNHIALHKGDLDKFMAGEGKKRDKRRAVPKVPSLRKRKQDSHEEKDDLGRLEDFENVLTHQERPIKQPRFW